ncbi:cilia- and flagella-associated protein 300-like [Polistes fuscatus]|uniref:cilia- and flagella-associated protein 300-like n=1 Tax=Polistes fuscatus TaxID=30207 RepID=UPI001CA99265|nr:cilia- and flagella-associated protein 300-like [Polistes fuscatus]
MDLIPQYTFIPLACKNYFGINDKETQNLLNKWGLKTNIIIQHFSFNEPFYLYHKYHFTEAFFKNCVVAENLLTKTGNSWTKQGVIASTVDVEQMPCSVINMSFFDKLRNPDKGIISSSGVIRKRYDSEIHNFLVSDKLREMLLDEESDQYNLYSKDERNEFIFCIFQMLVLGGNLCQYEDTLEPYLNTTKCIYKDLIRVQKRKNSEELSISTTVLKVIAKDNKNQEYFPSNTSCNIQNIGFLLIDGHLREVTTFLHQFSGYSD